MLTDFHERLYNYRYYELNMKSKEAAALLGLTPAHYSHYEKGRNKFPAELLKKLKENFGMSDEMFLEMVLDRPSKRQTAREIAERSREIQEAYLVAFAENYFDFIQQPEIRQLLAIMRHSTPEARAQQISEIKTLLNHSKTFQLKKAKDRKDGLPTTYKLNKHQTFALVDGDVLPKLFMKTDDVATEDE